jgi:hypothetical protein
LGTQAWYYVVPLGANVESAFESLREREFHAGRYFPALTELAFSLGEPPPGRGAQHDSIEAARQQAAEDGTKTILDFDRVDEVADWGTITPMDPEIVSLCLGTATPARQALSDGLNCLLEALDRGMGCYLLLYEQDQPAFVFFLGLSCD